MGKIANEVMEHAIKLQWIDLSHNYLVTLSEDIQKFVNLRTLYLHRNFIYDMKEFTKLQPLQNLKSLTIHGNPIETIPNFRLYVIGILPNLQRLDSVLVSKKERDNANVFINHFHFSQYPAAKNPQKPPEIVQPQTEANKNY
eukprot:TRINITY_DN10295_c0_g1_i1.p1 TRINITY_DN10295_c0_g1~~TRINITY_DN10295_c0_g1_i1.p1  ORF type:complete len:142 (+),score=26.85 TRINITY_DN10295_c0_g1_i1:100-525(+)